MLKRSTPTRAQFAASQRGLSLVELMVGIAVGLFVVAAAAMLVSVQLNDNRRLLLETQVQQDLRAAADLMTRELRRIGHWPDAAQFVWTAATGAPPNNPYIEIDVDDPGKVEFSYWRSAAEDGPFGFKHEGNVLKTLLGAGGWQELTDGNTLQITAFSVTPRDDEEPPTRLTCPKPCADGTNTCWPTLAVRVLDVNIEGRAASDPSIRRSLHSVVRLRNDRVDGACPA